MHVNNLKMIAAAACLLSTSQVMALEAPKRVECIAPAGPGGGLDFICRSIGKALNDQGVVSGNIQVTNMPGGGHGVGFAHTVSKRKGDAGVFVATSTGTVTRLAQNAYPGLDSSMVNWAAAMGAEPGVIAVRKDSPYQSLNEVLDALKQDPGSVTFAGASPLGGDDNLRVLLTAKRAGVDKIKELRYLSFNNGGDALVQVVGGHTDVFTGDLSESLGFFESGDLRILAVLADERLEGKLASVPTAKEQGVDVTWLNFRGVYVAPGISDEQYNWWQQTFSNLYETPEWKQIMQQNGLIPFHKTGAEFTDYINEQIGEVRQISQELGIIKS
ncbi:C4-dicarboxylate ABC transporter substrate-binding protein [Zobellella taiwanensis]|uniref:C4-dicarboxylate ABC transporter substrate-binding protein n=1 Tax=Zobellella taiwanensis TaxID=347535 RepID=A0A2P7RAG0_9GAMM|nr:tripartite tricarboxylate transporter substrate-binding protein [Zobellella taiwanensis]PSJ47214.1 C4-dicarboxylate ABC transporter substrate-binding protein [Zobellella taiwanensis]